MIYAATLSESQRVMQWISIIGKFGPDIQHIAGVDNIVADMLSRFPPASIDKNKTSTMKSQCRAYKLFDIIRLEENNKYYFLLSLLSVQENNISS